MSKKKDDPKKYGTLEERLKEHEPLLKDLRKLRKEIRSK